MLRDPDKKGQHELMGVAIGLFNVDPLEFGSGVNYLSAAANQKARDDHSGRKVLREALTLLKRAHGRVKSLRLSIQLTGSITNLPRVRN